MARQEKHRNSQPAVPAPARGMSPAWLLPILLCLCLGLRIVISLTAFSKGGFLFGPLTDDSFYSLGIARNLAAGAGFTFDGINLTNGFQPLYVFLMVPVYALFPHDPMTPVKIAVLLLALCNTAAGFFLWRILRREVSARAAVFGLALFAFSPYIAEVGLNGLESSLALLLFLAALDLYLARVRPGTDRRAHRLGLAALLALLVFARVDGALLAAAIAADYLLRRDPLPFRARAFKMAGIAAAAVALYSPWLIFSRLHFGTALPQSGDAVRLMAQLYGEMEMPIAVPPSSPATSPPASTPATSSTPSWCWA